MTAHASGARNLFDAARQAISVQELAEREGLKLRRAGQELRGSCPLCGAGQGSKSIFAVKGDHWKCFGCNPRGGDVVDLERELRGGTPADAARRLAGREIPTGPARSRPASKPTPQGPTPAERIAEEMWREARPFAGSLGETYLRRRGISRTVIALAAPNLRFHPNAKHGWDDRAGCWVTAPAMVVQVVTPDGPTGGVHATYLDRVTGAKARLDPAKRMWGPQVGPDRRPGGAWLIGPGGSGDLVVSEGIETGLSVATLAERAGRRVRVAAALSLNRLQGGVARDAEGCVDLFDPRPDPDFPPFTWPTPPDAPWAAVMAAVDRDMSPVRMRGRSGRDKPLDFELGAEARARLCGRLVTLGWKAAGAASAIWIAPPPGKDFNDELRRVLALEGEA